MVLRNEQCWYKDVCTKESCDNCIRFEEMQFLIEHSGIPHSRQKPQKLFAEVDYNQFIELTNIKNNIVSFVEGGSNLYICSKETGNGKTSWAIKILLKYFDEIWAGNGFRVRGYFIHVPSMLNMLKDFGNEKLSMFRETLSKVDLLVWDDIAATKMSDYDLGQFTIILDERINEGKSNIFTSNITEMSELQKMMGDRLTSRIWHCSRIIEFKGKDRRAYGSTADTE